MINIVSVKNLSASQLQNITYIGRKSGSFQQSPLHNPFKLLAGEQKGSTLEHYRRHLWQAIQSHDPAIMAELKKLLSLLEDNGEITLGCWCKKQPNDPTPCHGDIIKKCLEWMQLNA